MYTDLKNYQIIMVLLKKYGIKHVDLSAGSRNIPFVYSVENDPFFICYSVVDERSAAYFALGISQHLGVPVAISCTSSTATCNYLPAITEAFYQGIPLIVLTGDRPPYYLGQMENQMIQQVGMYKDVCKKSVNLPMVNTDEDFWYCERLVNEALLELNHNGIGPIHINIPVSNASKSLTAKVLPAVREIRRIELGDNILWELKKNELNHYNKILVICGQYVPRAEEEIVLLDTFSRKYNCVVAVEHMSNISCYNALNLCLVSEVLSYEEFSKLKPDLVISFGGNITSALMGLLRNNHSEVHHWLISQKGEIIDAFKCLTDIFECSLPHFLKYFIQQGNIVKNSSDYYNTWKKHIKDIKWPDFEYSNLFVIRHFIQKIPEPSILHLSVLNSIRMSQFFSLPSGVRVYANIGTDGIDGCMSAFLGQSCVFDKLAFLVIGDLSFFYDMNSLRIRHIKNNVRILLINNHGGAEFHYNTGKKKDPTIDLHTAAKHNTTALGWAESVGFKYLSAHTQAEYMLNIDTFVNPDIDHPILYEVFTDMEKDASVLHDFYNMNRNPSFFKRVVKSVLSDTTIEYLKRLQGR